MKIFSTTQTRGLDAYSIQHEPIKSIDLMERAAGELCKRLTELIETSCPVILFAGPGNNGGDALAIARMLHLLAYEVQVYLIANRPLSEDCETNLYRMRKLNNKAVVQLADRFEPPVISDNHILIDGLFGSGLSRSLSGIYAETVAWINEQNNLTISIDIPSGMQGEQVVSSHEKVVVADVCLTLQYPKLSFFFSENEKYLHRWEIIDIGIHPQALIQTETVYHLINQNTIRRKIKKRAVFCHKGNFGHVLIGGGSRGMAGAAILAARAALRTGAGLVSVHGPECNREITQTALPEALFSSDENYGSISSLPDTKGYSCVALGPGMGHNSTTSAAIEKWIKYSTSPCVLDADALNILSEMPGLLAGLPANSILTPHPKEFERMFGRCATSHQRITKASEMAQKHQLVIVLKGAYTCVALPDGQIYFNSTGNAGMATAGSGDVLTGIISSLLAQGYSAENSALLGVYIHGLAGDCALEKETQESLIASDIIAHLCNAFATIDGAKRHY